MSTSSESIRIQIKYPPIIIIKMRANSKTLTLPLVLSLIIATSTNGLTSLPASSPTSTVAGLLVPGKDTLTDFLIDSEYLGNYQRNQPTSLFGYLESASGQFNLLFLSYSYPSQANLNAIVISLFDPIYHDRKAVEILISVPKVSPSGSWSSDEGIAKITKFWKAQDTDEYTEANVKYTISLSQLSTEDPHQIEVNVEMHGSDFSFSGSSAFNDELTSALGYSLYVSGVLIAQLVCAHLLLIQVKQPASTFKNKLSITTLSFCTVQDFCLGLIHFFEIFSSPSNGYLLYILPVFFYMTMCLVFDVKLLIVAWAGYSRRRQLDNLQFLRKRLAFILGLYVGMVAYLLLSLSFASEEWLILGVNLFIIPQIIHNARVGNNPGFSALYAFGYLGLRLALPLYERSCPGNHFRLAPEAWLASLLCLLYALQLLFLVLQYKLGPRFFIPRSLRPNYFDYDFKLSPTHENQHYRCRVCDMGIFDDEDLHDSEMERQMISEKAVIRTPCSHYFHRRCFRSWTDEKMECPTCRAALPPL